MISEGMHDLIHSQYFGDNSLYVFRHDSFFPAAEQVAALDIPTLRSAGLSQRKAEYSKVTANISRRCILHAQ